MKTLVLLSGGLDSATVLALALKSGNECEVVGFDYGQPQQFEEWRAATQIATHYKVPFAYLVLPSMRKIDDVVFAGRNLVLAAAAIAMAQEEGFGAIGVGCNENDWHRFPDCRPTFWQGLRDAAGGAYDIHVWTPLLHMPKKDVAAMARELEVPIDMTWSCYMPRNHEPCGVCYACTSRKDALA